jgi:hypothetical protein
MKAFTVRVELHKAGNIESFYETLHAEMKTAGFSKTISKNGQKLKLPTAEYNLEGNFEPKVVLEKAKTAAGKVGLEFSVLVTPTESERESYNLKPEVLIRIPNPLFPLHSRK